MKPLPTASSSGTVTNARPISTMPSSVRGRPMFILLFLDGSRAPVPCSEFSFPFQRRFYDLGKVVVPRLPAEGGTDTSGASDQRRWIAGPTRFLPLGNRVPCDALDHGKQLADAIAPPVTAVQCRGFAAAAQVGQRFPMGVRELLDMDVVAAAGAVRAR